MMREKLQKLMQGRYGYDELNRMLLLLDIIILAAGIFIRKIPALVLTAIGWVILIIVCLRAFSKDYNTCWAQNEKYLSIKNRLLVFLRIKKKSDLQKKTHRIFLCPHCGQKIRIPRGKGKVQIRCPKCKWTFVRRS